MLWTAKRKYRVQSDSCSRLFSLVLLLYGTIYGLLTTTRCIYLLPIFRLSASLSYRFYSFNFFCTSLSILPIHHWLECLNGHFFFFFFIHFEAFSILFITIQFDQHKFISRNCHYVRFSKHTPPFSIRQSLPRTGWGSVFSWSEYLT